jgi:hypothetical protein
MNSYVIDCACLYIDLFANWFDILDCFHYKPTSELAWLSINFHEGEKSNIDYGV